MPNTRLPNSIFFALVALGAVQLSYYAPRIPEILGSHFARGGFVNGWQTKAAFFSTELAMIVLATVVSFGIPRIIAAVPVSLINLPHKEYWLASERREDTLVYIRVWSAWFGSWLFCFSRWSWLSAPTCALLRNSTTLLSSRHFLRSWSSTQR